MLLVDWGGEDEQLLEYLLGTEQASTDRHTLPSPHKQDRLEIAEQDPGG